MGINLKELIGDVDKLFTEEEAADIFKRAGYTDYRWKEWFVGKCTFYFGDLPKKDYRLGLHLGNKEGSVDLLIVTFGYLRD